jgi:hypothetical protein
MDAATIPGRWAGLGVAAARGVRAGLPRPGPSPLRCAPYRHRAAGAGPAAWSDSACARVAIERPDGPVVAVLLAAGLEVVVIPGRQVKALRGR